MLAFKCYQENPHKSVKGLAASYKVPYTTLRDRIHGATPRAETSYVKRKLSPTEEQSLLKWVLDLDRRGFPPNLINIQQMADRLLAARTLSSYPLSVGKNWTQRYVTRQPRLKTRWNRKFSSQRAECEDREAIQAWFKLVSTTCEELGIQDDDIYNFDETGFPMGVAATSTVVTDIDTIGRPKVIQPGDREWVTAIEGCSSTGYVLPAFLVLSGKVHQAAWYRLYPSTWTIAVSESGWTSDEIALKWIQHFETHTKTRTKGVYRLLILDGHHSHCTPEFDQYCRDHNIATLCMPPHTSHLLQPLDVGCFGPLKLAYGQAVAELARQSVYHVEKLDFLRLYQAVRLTAFTEANVKAGFSGAGIRPWDPDHIIETLPVIHTPPQAPTPSTWTAETPHTTDQLRLQAQLIRDLRQRDSHSPTARAIAQVVKGCQLAMQAVVILTEENNKLRAANSNQHQKKRERRQYIATGGVLTGAQGRALITEADKALKQASQPLQKRAPPTCSKCHQQGHNRIYCRNVQ